MAYALGIILFAFGILFAVCVHEAGHMVAAKAFGMKVTRYFVGFGPTLWSFRRHETEYGVKALPLGGFVKIVGMTPQDDDVEPADEKRAMWRFPVWKRTVVMTAGSFTHFILAIVALWVLFAVVGIPDEARAGESPAKIREVASCVKVDWEYDPVTRAPRACDPGTDPASPATRAGLRAGDVITAIDGQPTPTFDAMRERLAAVGGRPVEVTYARDGETHATTVTPINVERIRTDTTKTRYADIGDGDLERGYVLGVSMDIDYPTTTYGPVEAVGKTFSALGTLAQRTFESMRHIPEKIPNLFRAIMGEERDPETPVSVVGASRIGGELFEIGDWATMLSLFATLNLFFGVFNLFPLLPMDGGHIAIAWFERVRSWIAAKRGRPDPGRVDYYKLAPITLGVIGILGVFVLLTVTADIVNPITLTK